jgi:urease accessory protein
MSAAVSPSEFAAADPLAAVRAVGGVALSTCVIEGRTRLDALHETGGYRAKFPDHHGDTLEAVLVNTGGGVAGGDRVTIDARAGAGARLSLTTATAERIYRSTGADATIDITLDVSAGATLAWLPQASVLFSGARVRRCIDANFATDSVLLAAETTVFGRTASGESMASGFLSDQWRIRRDGRLIFADATRLDGAIVDTLARPAVAAGAPITSLLLCAAPGIESRRDAVRAVLDAETAFGGASTWNDLLVVRILPGRLDRAAATLRRVVAAIDVCPLPTAWTH